MVASYSTLYPCAQGEGSSTDHGTQQVWNGRGECVYVCSSVFAFNNNYRFQSISSLL